LGIKNGQPIISYNDQKSKKTMNLQQLNANELRIGGSANNNAGYRVDAQVLEVLLFDQNKFTQGLDKVIHSYLAIKYGIEQNSGDRGVWNYHAPNGKVIWDGGYAHADSCYHHIAGIGKSSDMKLDQRQSTSVAIGNNISFSTGNTFGDDIPFENDEAYLLWGHNQKPTEIFSSLITNELEDAEISQRIWRLSATNLGSTSVSVAINLSNTADDMETNRVIGVLLADNPLFANAKFTKGTLEDGNLTINDLPVSGTQYMTIVTGAEADQGPTTNIAGRETKTPEQPMSLYPNPAKNEVTINTPFEGKLVEVFSASGTLLYSSEFTSGQLNISSMPNGILYVRVKGEDKVAVGKVIKTGM
jgi:uncharacterized protein YegP (UPF0339 family)